MSNLSLSDSIERLNTNSFNNRFHEMMIRCENLYLMGISFVPVLAIAHTWRVVYEQQILDTGLHSTMPTEMSWYIGEEKRGYIKPKIIF